MLGPLAILDPRVLPALAGVRQGRRIGTSCVICRQRLRTKGLNVRELPVSVAICLGRAPFGLEDQRAAGYQDLEHLQDLDFDLEG